ncbi:MFS general substrate transporter [Athelia psychrophila]|uniref:MFS general substrate transporter n=1 Tax=Athelia psychrophila TaxID=1759441 RepID=A0A166S1H1_9AGAM|nr:MFS general substrate transporter [Fibularhizoctonia sp. CBS 109695]
MIPSLTRRRHLSGPAAPSETSVDPELQMPKRSSLIILLTSHLLLQISFFIPVASANSYVQHLGGTSAFSGVVLGVPVVAAGLAIIPMMKYDKDKYMLSIHVSCASSILGSILYSLAYPTNYLYLVLIGRIVNGIAFSSLMYNKKAFSDARWVGVRRRTTLGSWITVMQGLGISVGPFLGGILFKVGFQNHFVNGYTSPGWIMAVAWSIFWVCAIKWYEDVPDEPEKLELRSQTASTMSPSRPGASGHDVVTSAAEHDGASDAVSRSIMTLRQWGVVFCMCWFAIICWFILGSWEANLPIYGAAFPQFQWSPFAAGNFIALGGACAFPFLLANLFIARRIQDRKLLVFGTALGTSGLIIFLALLYTQTVSYGTLFVSWWSIALGFNLASTVTVSLLSKQLPDAWNKRSSLAIQLSTYVGRVGGALWGGSGVKVGMKAYAGLEIGLVGIGATLFCVLWRDLKAKRG